ncbi:MAG: pyridoxine 5'-phosphate synthase [Candidatus Margulisbacteria bacterium]|nr:pyridoxine 5'-phosphate synthase [Candidatus Margulisiibacteriota bacterium]
MTRLGVNIDHIATLRQQRKEGQPNLADAARWAIAGGADNITMHLREDRRHIQDSDIFDLRPLVNELNFECATASDIIDIAIQVTPEWACIVPEKRTELTTEGGLYLAGNNQHLQSTIQKLQDHGIQVSLFINPTPLDVEIAKSLNANGIELHTGTYALSPTPELELAAIKDCASLAADMALKVQAGHGLNYSNIIAISQIAQIEEVNIGHSIICRAVEVGLTTATQEMKRLLNPTNS